jgi:hypothetical protein
MLPKKESKNKMAVTMSIDTVLLTVICSASNIYYYRSCKVKESGPGVHKGEAQSRKENTCNSINVYI